MASFDFEGKSIYYEDEGEGKPLLLLNGIMMSVKSWQPFVPAFTKNNRLIRLDFLDQGQSHKMETAFTQDIQAEVVKALLDRLNIPKVCVVGISYGGEIALLFALKYPEITERLVLFNTTPATGDWLRDIGRGWNLIAESGGGLAYYHTTIPVIYSSEFYKRESVWMEKRKEKVVPVFSNPAFLAAMIRLTNSAENFDVSNRLQEISCPTLIVSAEQDCLTPPIEQQALHSGIKSSHLVIIPDSGHASMYEKPLLFAALVLGFVNVSQIDYIV